jgi:hypothetical protein
MSLLLNAGLAHERVADSDKCTMINPNAQRHLRDAPSAPIVRSFAEVPKVAAGHRQDAACSDGGDPDSRSLHFKTGSIVYLF